MILNQVHSCVVLMLINSWQFDINLHTDFQMWTCYTLNRITPRRLCLVRREIFDTWVAIRLGIYLRFLYAANLAAKKLFCVLNFRQRFKAGTYFMGADGKIPGKTRGINVFLLNTFVMLLTLVYPSKDTCLKCFVT